MNGNVSEGGGDQLYLPDYHREQNLHESLGGTSNKEKDAPKGVSENVVHEHITVLKKGKKEVAPFGFLGNTLSSGPKRFKFGEKGWRKTTKKIVLGTHNSGVQGGLLVASLLVNPLIKVLITCDQKSPREVPLAPAPNQDNWASGIVCFWGSVNKGKKDHFPRERLSWEKRTTSVLETDTRWEGAEVSPFLLKGVPKIGISINKEIGPKGKK